MGTRYTAIIGSTLGINRYQARLREDLVNDSINSMSQALVSLGDEYSFKLLGKKGYYKNPSAKTIRNDIEKIPRQDHDSVFLLYYYGHAGIISDDKTIFAFSELTKSTYTTEVTKIKCSFERLIEHITDRGFQKLIIFLDCCHSGLAATNITGLEANWALFSSTGRKVQTVDSLSNSFTQNIFRYLTDIDLIEKAANPGATSLTVKLLADAVTNTVSNITGLSPTLSGHLHDFPMVSVKIRTPAAVNRYAPKKSLYNKLFTIALLFNNSNVVASKINFILLKRLLKKDQIFYVVNSEGKPVLISDYTLKEYMHIGSLVKLWDELGGDEWRANPSNLIDSEGTLYNKYLVEGVLSHLPKEVREAEIKKCVYEILHVDLEPTYFRINKELQDKYGPWQTNLIQRYRKILIALLGYAHVLKRASFHTYFPR